MSYREDWRQNPRDPRYYGTNPGERPKPGNYEGSRNLRETHPEEYSRAEYYRDEARDDFDRGLPHYRPQGRPNSRRGIRPLFGQDYGDFPNRNVVGSSMEADDYAFFNAGNYGRHYGSGYGTAQPSRSFADQNLREDWYPSYSEEAPSARVQRTNSAEQSSHRGRGPRGYIRSDERILEEAHERLTEDHHIDASNISVTVKNCEITLDGTVDNRAAKRHAEDIVERISGVTHTQNNLRVEKNRSEWEKESDGIAQATAQIKH